MNRSGKCFLDRPFEDPEAPFNIRSAYSSNSSPLSNSFGFILESDTMISAGVISLSIERSPYAIFRAVISLAIEPFYGITSFGFMFRRWFSHIFKKVFKKMPSFTYCNTPTSVAMLHRIFLIIASCFHGHPSPIYRGMRFSMGSFGVYSLMNCFLSVFRLQASTRFCQTSAKRGTANHDQFSTNTATFPAYFFIFAALFHGIQGGKPPKYSSGDINHCAHYQSPIG